MVMVDANTQMVQCTLEVGRWEQGVVKVNLPILIVLPILETGLMTCIRDMESKLMLMVKNMKENGYSIKNTDSERTPPLLVTIILGYIEGIRDMEEAFGYQTYLEK